MVLVQGMADVDDRDLERQPRPLLPRGGREAAGDQGPAPAEAFIRRSLSAGTTRASTCTSGPERVYVWPRRRPDAPSRSCSTPTWRRCARATTRSPRPRRRPPAGGAPVWDERIDAARRPLPHRGAVGRGAGRLPVLGPGAGRRPTGRRAACASTRTPSGVPVQPGLACVTAHDQPSRTSPGSGTSRCAATSSSDDGDWALVAPQARRRLRAAARLGSSSVPAEHRRRCGASARSPSASCAKR